MFLLTRLIYFIFLYYGTVSKANIFCKVQNMSGRAMLNANFLLRGLIIICHTILRVNLNHCMHSWKASQIAEILQTLDISVHRLGSRTCLCVLFLMFVVPYAFLFISSSHSTLGYPILGKPLPLFSNSLFHNTFGNIMPHEV